MRFHFAFLPVLTAALFLASLSFSVADQLSDGLAAYRARSYEQALILLEPLAASGNAEAQYTVGMMYINGEGTDFDAEKGLEWQRKAGIQGHEGALFILALHLLSGSRVERNPSEAAQWLTIFAEQGSSYAQVRLGGLYFTGDGVRKDIKKAIGLYQAAASNPNDPSPFAQIELARLYETGVGLPRDFARAKIWYERAAAQGNSDAYVGLGGLYERGDGVAQDFVLAHKNYNLAVAYSDYADDDSEEETKAIMYKLADRMSMEQISESQDQAVIEYEKNNQIGAMIGMAREPEKSLLTGRQTILGQHYKTGFISVPQHYRRAMELLKAAADRGSRVAQFHLAEMYQKGLGIEPDMVQAYKWFNIAASDQCEPYCGLLHESEYQAKIQDQAKQMRDVIASSISPEELARAQELSRKWHALP